MIFHAKLDDVLMLNMFLRATPKRTYFVFDMAIATEGGSVTTWIPAKGEITRIPLEYDRMFRDMQRGFFCGQGIGWMMQQAVIDALPVLEAWSLFGYGGERHQDHPEYVPVTLTLPAGRYRIPPLAFSFESLLAEDVWFPTCVEPHVQYTQGGRPEGFQMSDYPIGMVMNAHETAGIVDGGVKCFRSSH